MTLFGDPLFDDLVFYELCFPGAVTGSTEVACLHCGERLTVLVNDPLAKSRISALNAAAPLRSTGVRYERHPSE
jgi:hypothetical protein